MDRKISISTSSEGAGESETEVLRQTGGGQIVLREENNQPLPDPSFPQRRQSERAVFGGEVERQIDECFPLVADWPVTVHPQVITRPAASVICCSGSDATT